MASTTSNIITSSSYHEGVCVDEKNGIYLVRRNKSGASFCSHVQYCPNGNPPVMACQVTSCKDVMDTASRSGMQGFICSHLQSVPHISKIVPSPQQLSIKSLHFLINEQLLKPSWEDECLRYQAVADRVGVPMIVQLIGNSYNSSRYLNFSVWNEASGKKWWSFCGRVCVTYDYVNHMWHCKHVKGSQSCIHKTVVKWYMAETKQYPYHQGVGNDECCSDDTEHGDGESDDDDDEISILHNSCVTISWHYPPEKSLAEKMSRYVYSWKKIPLDVPLTLRSGASSFPERFIPRETHCKMCPDNPPLSEPYTVTKSGKLLTTTPAGLITGIEICVKFCPVCQLPYRYQEWEEGVHNFNDFWLFSLGFMDLVRQFFKVHTAFSRVCEALKRWLDMSSVPVSVVRNAYLHYEALSCHPYNYFCVLCGHNPYLLVTDADKKGIFDLSASELEVPEDGNDEVDADFFWESVDLSMIFRGFSHTGSSDAQNPFTVKPSYKFWAPWVGRFTRKDSKLINSEHRKCRHDLDEAEFGTHCKMNVEDLMEVLEQGSVKVLKELCQKLEIPYTSKHAKLDIIKKLKEHLEIPSQFTKVFSKFWGGSGGWLGAACQHGICYGMKWLIRQEGARDHVDLIKSLAYQPNFIIVDFANQVAAHGNTRCPDMFTPNEGCVLPPTPENISLAKMGQVSLDMPWIARASRGQHFPTTSTKDTRCHPITGSSQYFCLFDTFHEHNSSNDSDLLRRTRCVKQLEGWVCTEVMEHINNMMNKNNYFTTQMSATNAIFVQRLAMELSNEAKNRKIASLHQQQLGRQLDLNSNGQLVLATALPSSVSTTRSFLTPTDSIAALGTNLAIGPT